MKRNYDQVRNLIDSAKTLLTGVSINYNSEIGPKTKQLVDICNSIAPLIKEMYPEIANIFYDLPQDWRNYNQQKDDFLEQFNNNQRT